MTSTVWPLESISTQEPAIIEDGGGGRTRVTDIIVGIAMIFSALLCALAYSFILTGIYRDKDLIRMTSYKFMFFLGIVDVIQCLPHTITGIFTIFQTTFGHILPKIMGVLATPFYVAYAIMTVILSINRFIQLASPTWDRRLFSPKGVRLWIGAAGLSCLVYMIVLSTPYASIIYYPEAYSWDYVRDENQTWSVYVQKVEMVIEVGGIFVAAFFYGGVLIILCRTRNIFQSSRNFRIEAKILIQALVITVYCTILNVFWHNYQVLLPASIWSYMALNFMWIFNSGIYPIIYFLVNKTIRDRVRQTGITRVEHSIAVNRNHRNRFVMAVNKAAAIPGGGVFSMSAAETADSKKPFSGDKSKWGKRFTVPFMKSDLIQKNPVC